MMAESILLTIGLLILDLQKAVYTGYSMRLCSVGQGQGCCCRQLMTFVFVEAFLISSSDFIRMAVTEM